MNTGQPRIIATLIVISLSLCACGGGGAGGGASSGSGGTGQSPPASSGSSPNPVPNPVPTITILSPSCAPAGQQFIDGVDNQLTVITASNGPDFVPGSVVRWNGSDRPTTSNGSSNALTAQISASDIAAAGTAVVTVFNPAPGGGSSNPLTFTISTGPVDPQSVAVDPAGKFAYVASAGCGGGTSDYVSMYTINPTTGVLASIGPAAPAYGYFGNSYPASVTLAPSGKVAYVTNSGYFWDLGGGVLMYTINATTGALTLAGGVNGNCPGVCFPSSMVVSPSGKFAYVAGGGPGGAAYNALGTYAIDATTGALTSIESIAADDPVSVTVDPSGKFAYVVNASGSAGTVSRYAINAATGALTSLGTIAAGTDPVSVTVDPSGKFVYVVNSGSNDVSMYTIDATTGALTSMGTIAAGTAPISVAVVPSVKFAYVVNSGSNNVSMYTINSTTGSLTLMGTIAAGPSPSSIAIHPSGNFAYVTNAASNNVSTYSIGSTGTLTLVATIGT